MFILSNKIFKKFWILIDLKQFFFFGKLSVEYGEKKNERKQWFYNGQVDSPYAHDALLRKYLSLYHVFVNTDSLFVYCCFNNNIMFQKVWSNTCTCISLKSLNVFLELKQIEHVETG